MQISSSTFSVLVNNELGPTFKPKCGLRQGDPIAPFIFILAMEYLTRTLQHEALQRTPKVGIQLTTQGTRIPFLCFADDTLIFAHATTRNMIYIKNMLTHFPTYQG